MTTALVRTDDIPPALAPVRTDPLSDAIRQFQSTLGLAGALVKSGFLPKAINTPEKAVAVILAGRELGIGPMLALRSISIIDGKPVVAADLQLARFKADGGRAVFTELSEAKASLSLRHPNGDEHTESFTMADARAAGLLGKDNWKKFPKAMLRSRCITAALKSIGYEPTCGVYDPDEADSFRPLARTAVVADDNGADDTGDGDVEPAVMTIDDALTMPLPGKPSAWSGKGGTPLGQLNPKLLAGVRKWVDDKITDAEADGNEAPQSHYDLRRACDMIMALRATQAETAPVADVAAPVDTRLKPGKVEDALDSDDELPF